MLSLRLRPAVSSLLLAAGWALVWLGHTYVVPQLRQPLLIGLADPAVHGLVALLLVLPLWLRRVVSTPVAVVAVLAGVLIDLDHAVAARSFSFRAMLTLPGRPLGHSLLVATLVAGVLALLLRRYGCWWALYLCSIALASHIARDGATPWAWPWAAPAIPAVAFWGVFVPLSFAHLWMSRPTSAAGQMGAAPTTPPVAADARGVVG